MTQSAPLVLSLTEPLAPRPTWGYRPARGTLAARKENISSPDVSNLKVGESCDDLSRHSSRTWGIVGDICNGGRRKQGQASIHQRVT